MHLDLTNLKDLEYICRIALDYFDRRMGTTKEIEWLQRIAKYQQMFEAEVLRLEAEDLFGHPDPGQKESDGKADA